IRVQARIGGNTATRGLFQLFCLCVEGIDRLVVGLLRLLRLREILLFNTLLLADVGLFFLRGQRYSTNVFPCFCRERIVLHGLPVHRNRLRFLPPVCFFAFILRDEFVARQQAAQRHFSPSGKLRSSF